MDELKETRKKALSSINSAGSLKELESLFKNLLGKKGEVSSLFKSLKNLPSDEKKKKGKELNDLKRDLEKELEKKRKKLIKEESKKEKELFDFTLPGKKAVLGKFHPLTVIRKEATDLFKGMGFSIYEGPEIESEWYNFDALNFPKDHPAREMQDTLFIKKDNDKEKQLLMRTHTSPMQVRIMEESQPPLKIVVPGRVFRNEATDASHEINFYQLEGFMVGSDISVSNFRAIMEEFCKGFFKKDIGIRLRPSYFPFTEPSFEVDVECTNCLSEGCSVCSNTGWVEVIGAGMIHPNVLKNSGLNPQEWRGFAFGMGLDRLAMIRYRIDDVRLFYSGDLRFLKQF